MGCWCELPSFGVLRAWSQSSIPWVTRRGRAWAPPRRLRGGTLESLVRSLQSGFPLVTERLECLKNRDLAKGVLYLGGGGLQCTGRVAGPGGNHKSGNHKEKNTLRTRQCLPTTKHQTGRFLLSLAGSDARGGGAG